MGRRTVLLIVAALIAALGAGMVLVYVRGADSRAEASQQPVQVLKAVARIEAGESVSAAQAAGKIQLGTIARKEVLTGAKDSVAGMADEVALATIYPNEQIVADKFGAVGAQSSLAIPNGNIAISVTLPDTGRVADFVAPGNYVAIFTGGSGGAADTTRLLLPRVQVIAVGATTVSSKPTDAAAPPSTGAYTLSVNQSQAEKVMFAATHGSLSFALLNDKSKIAAGAGVNAQNLFR